MHFGERVRELRIERGLTQKELASRLDVSASYAEAKRGHSTFPKAKRGHSTFPRVQSLQGAECLGFCWLSVLVGA